MSLEKEFFHLSSSGSKTPLTGFIRNTYRREKGFMSVVSILSRDAGIIQGLRASMYTTANRISSMPMVPASGSLSSKLLVAVQGAIESLGQLPGYFGIPGISIKVRNATGMTNTAEVDERLEELREQIENNGGKPPFMFDNGMILRAAPKKKHSRSRRRMKLYAPGDKKISPLENLVRCPACGKVKRSHFMCMHCFAEIRTFLKGKKKDLQEPAVEPQADLDPVDQNILYPGKYEREYERRLKKKDWIPVREEPLDFNPKQVKPDIRK